MVVEQIESDLKQCQKILQTGGSILYPTDTIWGVGCDALNEKAVEKVFSIKQRPTEKSLVVLIAEAKDIFQWVATPPPDIINILESQMVPTTVVYENALSFPKSVIASDGSIAIRVTTDLFCKALIKRFGKPLVSTSANVSGKPFPKYFKDIDLYVKENVDYVVKYRQNDFSENQPSRIVRIDDDGFFTIIR